MTEITEKVDRAIARFERIARNIDEREGPVRAAARRERQRLNTDLARRVKRVSNCGRRRFASAPISTPVALRISACGRRATSSRPCGALLCHSPRAAGEISHLSVCSQAPPSRRTRSAMRARLSSSSGVS